VLACYLLIVNTVFTAAMYLKIFNANHLLIGNVKTSQKTILASIKKLK
jgi:hypothetical protein